MDCNRQWNKSDANNLTISYIDRITDPLSHQILFGFVTPAIVVLGVVLNIFTYKVFSNILMKSSILNWYLGVLSLSDIFILVTSFFTFSLSSLGIHFENYLLFNIANVEILLSYPLAMIAQTWNVWLTVVVSCHRFVGICYPFQEKRYCSKRNCRRSVIGVLLFSVIFNIPRFFETTLRKCYCNKVNYTLVVFAPSKLRMSKIYVNIYIIWFYSFIMFIVPFVGLIVMNGAVVLSLKKPFMPNRSKTYSGSIRRAKLQFLKEMRASLMMIGVVSEFLICNSLAFVVNVIELIDSLRNARNRTNLIYSDFYKTLIDISNAMIIFSAALNNIAIYCLVNPRFRRLLKHYASFEWFRNDKQQLVALDMLNI